MHSACRGPNILVQINSKHTGQVLVALRKMTDWQGRTRQTSSSSSHHSGQDRLVSEAYSQEEVSRASEIQLSKWLQKSQRVAVLKKNNRLLLDQFHMLIELGGSGRSFRTYSRSLSMSLQYLKTHISTRWVRSILTLACLQQTTSWGLIVHRITFRS